MSSVKYSYTNDADRHEAHVENLGYPYVNRIELGSREVLRPHAHNSLNTHYIVSGKLTVYHSVGGSKMGTYKAGNRIDIRAGHCYRAEAGANGCVFIEGHKDLSPTSADRFERLNSIVRTPNGNLKSNGKAQKDCTRGQCHWSYNEWFHVCQEFGDEIRYKEVCDVKDRM